MGEDSGPIPCDPGSPCCDPLLGVVLSSGTTCFPDSSLLNLYCEDHVSCDFNDLIIQQFQYEDPDNVCGSDVETRFGSWRCDGVSPLCSLEENIVWGEWATTGSCDDGSILWPYSLGFTYIFEGGVDLIDVCYVCQYGCVGGQGCAPGPACQDGGVCDSPLTCCSGYCVNLDSSLSNCGECNVSCDTGSLGDTCSDGECGCGSGPACSAGECCQHSGWGGWVCESC
jgi:hypothetical protein